jgi:3-oxoacyl-[acyl-carrier-protein] synthase III
MDIGIMGHGTYIPTGRMTAADIAIASGIPEDIITGKFGIKEKPVPGPEDTTARMGIIAAERAMRDAGIAASELDLVIWCGAQHKDYPCWLAGLYVANELGAGKAWSFDMEAMCGSMMAALDTAKSIMLAKPRVNTVLLVSGYRNGDLIDPAVVDTQFMLNIGAGGAALVLRKGHPRNLVLESSFRGDGSFSRDCVVPYMGSAAWPPKTEHLGAYRFEVSNPGEFKKKLGERTLPNFYAVVRESLADSGLSQRDIDYLAILHFKRSAHEAILAELGLDENKTTYLEDYGHIGQNDQILSLELGLRAGRIKAGNNIVLVGAGLGFVWAATVIRWG